MGRTINPRQRPQRGAWRYITLLAALVVMSLPSGCAPISATVAPKAYEGPALPKEKFAVITTTGSEKETFVRVAKIDGKGCFARLLGMRMRSCGGYAEVLPGQHDIELEHHAYVSGVIGLSPATATRRLSFNAEAGHLYLARSDIWYLSGPDLSSEQAWFWIEDDATGEVVAGTKPSANE